MNTHDFFICVYNFIRISFIIPYSDDLIVRSRLYICRHFVEYKALDATKVVIIYETTKLFLEKVFLYSKLYHIFVKNRLFSSF